MGEYLAAPALLDEPAVQQSFLSYFNTIVCVSGRRSMFIMERDACAPVDASVRARAPLLPCAAFPLGKSIGLYQKRGCCLEGIP